MCVGLNWYTCVIINKWCTVHSRMIFWYTVGFILWERCSALVYPLALCTPVYPTLMYRALGGLELWSQNRGAYLILELAWCVSTISGAMVLGLRGPMCVWPTDSVGGIVPCLTCGASRHALPFNPSGAGSATSQRKRFLSI